MHTRCCEEIDRFNNISVGISENKVIDLSGYDDLAVGVEAFFTCNAPTAGQIFVGNGVWTGQSFQFGRLVEVVDFLTVNASIGAGLNAGFEREFPLGIGRKLVIRNNMDAVISNMFISIRKIVTIVTPNDKTPERQYG